MAKFEVGKKYRGLLNPATIVECLYVSPEGSAVMSYCCDVHPTNQKEHFTHPNEGQYWEEYREPVKRWFNKYRLNDGSVKLVGKVDTTTKGLYGFLTCSEASSAAPNHPAYWTYLGTVEIEF